MAVGAEERRREPASHPLTFLFTDIEGSTRLWEEHQRAMKEALERHDAILRAAVGGMRGQVVKTIGDGFMAVFDSAVDGVRACFTAQRDLLNERWGETGPLRVRMGLHAGEAATREGDYFGPTLNRTARIMSACHGGQVLLSAAAAALARDSLPGGATLEDLGEHQLKGLGRPERVYQLTYSGLPASFPPLGTPTRRRSRLPEQPSAFVGRETELAEIAARLADDAVRLLTLTGPGGIGKTRLALRAASAAIDRFEDGVFFVDLATARDTEAVLAAIASTIGLDAPTAETLLDEVSDRLHDEYVLLILDNFEQVTAAAAPAVARLLQDCARLKLLVTSREALRLSAEHQFAVRPLSLPSDSRRRVTAAELASYEAIELFVERARAVKPDFRLTDDNAAAVAEICRRLDGLPLALELATARINLFSPDALGDRLDDSLQLLRAGARELPVRQQTLRATIDWSYELLEPGEQRLFELLAAFAGASFDAVEAVAASLNGRLDVDSIDGLASLVDKSLVRQTGADGDPWFVMLATIRDYAAERLQSSPEFDVAARRAHASYFADFTRREWERISGDRRDTALAALRANAENLRRAWRHWTDERDLDQLDKLIDGLWLVYESQGRYHGMVELARQALDVLSSAPPTDERALQELTLRTILARALQALHGFTDEVEEEYQRALALFEGKRGVPQLFPVLRALAGLHAYRGEFDEALDRAHEILQLADAQDDPSMRVDGHLMVGVSLAFSDNLESGIDHLEHGIRCFESQRSAASHRFQVGPHSGIACYTSAGLTLWLRGFPDRAVERANRSLTMAMDLRHPFTMAYALYHTGFLHLLRQEPEPMRDRGVGVLDVADEYELPIWRALGTVLLGAAKTDMGHVDEGLAEIGDGIAQYQGLRSPPVFWPLLMFVRARACARGGRPAEGLEFIDQALALAGDAGILPPLFHAMKGELLLAMPERGNAAESFRRGFERAAEAGARLPQLRAAAGLCRAQPTEEHRELLRALHGTLTEGFETPDLVEARELLATAPA